MQVELNDCEDSSEYWDGRGPLVWLDRVQQSIYEFIKRNSDGLRLFMCIIAIGGYHVFLVLALWTNFKKAQPIVCLTVLVWVCTACRLVSRAFLDKKPSSVSMISESMVAHIASCRLTKPALCMTFLCSVIAFLLIDTAQDRTRLTGLGGMACLVLVMVLGSRAPSRIRWRPVLVGYALQFLMGLLVLRWEWGRARFGEASHLIVSFLDFTNNGTDFVYGFLSDPPNICSMAPVFAFKALQVILYFGAVVALLYYYGVMELLLKKMAWLMQLTLGTTAAESLNACACVFLGQSEAALLIRPYIDKMTASEIHAVMTSGLSCIAGSLFAAYIAFGACPTYLISSTVMSAPGSLACSKILCPETEESQLKAVEQLKLPPGKETNVLECVSNGAVAGVELIVAIVANLVVFLALLAFLNSCVGYAGSLVGVEGLTVELLLSYLFYPLAFVMGVTDPSETLQVAGLMGTKTVLNEFIAYKQLGSLIEQGTLSGRAAMIATYALCGFSNISSIGISMGILGGMAPQRKSLFAQLVLRALLAGSISCFMTASLAEPGVVL